MSTSEKKPAVRRSKKAGLTLSVSRLDKNIRDKNYSKKYSNECAVFMTGVLEYLVKEIVVHSATDETKRINPTTVFSGIRANANLSQLFANTKIGGSNFE